MSPSAELPDRAELPDPAELPVPAAVDAAVHDTVASVVAPGTWLTGAERATVAMRARAAWADAGDSGGARSAEPGGADPLLAAAGRIAAEPSAVTAGWIDRLEADGLDRLTYVEVVGVVARVAAVDAFAWTLDRPPPDLPSIRDGAASRVTVAAARRTSAWVPIAGPPNAVTALSAVEGEARARSRLSAALYVEDHVVHEASSGRGGRDGLSRPQMEVVAARVSYGNECFY